MAASLVSALHNKGGGGALAPLFWHQLCFCPLNEEDGVPRNEGVPCQNKISMPTGRSMAGGQPPLPQVAPALKHPHLTA